MTLDVQLLSIISMVISGIYLGVARETYQRFSSAWKKSTVIIYLAEVLFWLLQTIVVFFVLYKVNHGELRIYTFLSILLGYSVYVVMFRSLYQRLLTLGINFSCFVIRMTSRMITVLIIRPIQLMINVVIILLTSVLKVLLGIINILLYPVKYVFKKVNLPIPKKISHLFNKLSDIYSTIKVKLKKR